MTKIENLKKVENFAAMLSNAFSNLSTRILAYFSWFATYATLPRKTIENTAPCTLPV